MEVGCRDLLRISSAEFFEGCVRIFFVVKGGRLGCFVMYCAVVERLCDAMERYLDVIRRYGVQKGCCEESLLILWECVHRMRA